MPIDACPKKKKIPHHYSDIEKQPSSSVWNTPFYKTNILPIICSIFLCSSGASVLILLAGPPQLSQSASISRDISRDEPKYNLYIY